MYEVRVQKEPSEPRRSIDKTKKVGLPILFLFILRAFQSLLCMYRVQSSLKNVRYSDNKKNVWVISSSEVGLIVYLGKQRESNCFLICQDDL